LSINCSGRNLVKFSDKKVGIGKNDEFKKNKNNNIIEIRNKLFNPKTIGMEIIIPKIAFLEVVKMMAKVKHPIIKINMDFL
tara:strand:+ start:425 stop:667 length:243 start_codon:yes stop_codon:yes gene_type:complete